MRPVVELIRREIIANGVLSFARFMELALYCPDYGYYEAKTDNPGRRGDFYTSVSVGELFGQLLAFQFSQWLGAEAGNEGSEVGIVEAGAHDGTLAGDILNWLQSSRPGLFERLQYGIIEPSLRRQEWQKEKLEKFAPHVRWFADLKTLSRATRHSLFDGVFFSNELLDAMPVHRFGWDATAKKWFEWGVVLEGEKFQWARITESRHSSLVPHLVPQELLAVLPDGYTIEMSSAAENWWREAAGVWERGRLMTMDYGLGADELFSPGRPHGTLRAYFRHHLAADLLANAGEQDITAHVNFPVIQATGESTGLVTESFLTQAQFLTRILDEAAKDKSFGQWNASRTRQFQTLTHPEHLGRAFRILVQFRRPAAVRS
ncbi:MAG TPA: SAM-dependent methyltransferase [Verrucomicrobiae bacterium]|nr:SAM-dependent methyltransferase [Verrucomicrobiae bacterium]